MRVCPYLSVFVRDPNTNTQISYCQAVAAVLRWQLYTVLIDFAEQGAFVQTQHACGCRAVVIVLRQRAPDSLGLRGLFVFGYAYCFITGNWHHHP